MMLKGSVKLPGIKIVVGYRIIWCEHCKFLSSGFNHILSYLTFCLNALK